MFTENLKLKELNLQYRPRPFNKTEAVSKLYFLLLVTQYDTVRTDLWIYIGDRVSFSNHANFHSHESMNIGNIPKKEIIRLIRFFSSSLFSFRRKTAFTPTTRILQLGETFALKLSKMRKENCFISCTTYLPSNYFRS